MVSSELNRAVKEIHEEESSKLTQLNMSPLSRSRTIEKLLALGISSHHREQEASRSGEGHIGPQKGVKQ